MAGVDGLHELPVDVARLLIVAILLARERTDGFMGPREELQQCFGTRSALWEDQNLSTIKFKSTILSCTSFNDIKIFVPVLL